MEGWDIMMGCGCGRCPQEHAPAPKPPPELGLGEVLLAMGVFGRMGGSWGPWLGFRRWVGAIWLRTMGGLGGSGLGPWVGLRGGLTQGYEGGTGGIWLVTCRFKGDPVWNHGQVWGGSAPGGAWMGLGLQGSQGRSSGSPCNSPPPILGERQQACPAPWPLEGLPLQVMHRGGGVPFLTPHSLGRGSLLPHPAGRRAPRHCRTPALPAPHSFLRWVPPQASPADMGKEGWVPPPHCLCPPAFPLQGA